VFDYPMEQNLAVFTKSERTLGFRRLQYARILSEVVLIFFPL
jgi:hypothetical protein